MASKTEKKKVQVGDKIVTKRHGEILGAIVTAVNGDKITAVQIIGEDFTVDGEFILFAD